MTLHSVLAQSTVGDLATAERWYSTLFGRGPDTRPMDGLLEWYIHGGSGLQVWSEPERAGRSTVVFGDSDLDALAQRLAEAGVDHPGPEQALTFRILQLLDPDGNRVVITGD